jgi:MoaA/NifB/PqqE/SkfB family radical SAM enzyme
MLAKSYHFSRAARFAAAAGCALRVVQGKPLILNLNVNCTNACNQQCPMCNAELETKNSAFMKAEDFRDYLRILRPIRPMTCSLSGGEATLCPELPEMIDEAVRYFPFGVSLISNFYGTNARFRENVTAALKAGIRISCSLDAFGPVAELQRGAKNAAERAVENMEFVANKKRELGSFSPLVVHTVLSDATLSHVEQIFALSRRMGFHQHVAPVGQFFYQTEKPGAPKLSPSENLRSILKIALEQPHIDQNPLFLKGIFAAAMNKAPKLCPYVTPPIRYSKMFLDPNGDISFCDRHPIGNLRETPVSRMLKTELYANKLRAYQECRGCWMSCFVEPMLAIRPWHKRRLEKLFAGPVPEKSGMEVLQEAAPAAPPVNADVKQSAA